MEEDLGVDEISIIHASQEVLVICYQVYGEGRCKLATVVEIGTSGEYTIVISNDRFDFQPNGIDSPTIFRIPPNVLQPNRNNPELLGVCYVDADNGVCKFGEIDLNTMTIKFDEAETNAFGDRGIGEINAIYLGQNGDANSNQIVVCYIKFSGSTPLLNRGLCKYGTITQFSE